MIKKLLVRAESTFINGKKTWQNISHPITRQNTAASLGRVSRARVHGVMFIKKLRLVIALTLLILSGCMFGGVGHGYLSITGELTNREDQRIENCNAQLKELSTLGQPKKISGNFSTKFIVEPKTRQYFLTIECPNLEIFEKEITYSANSKLVELGKIILNEKTKT